MNSTQHTHTAPPAFAAATYFLFCVPYTLLPPPTAPFLLLFFLSSPLTLVFTPLNLCWNQTGDPTAVLQYKIVPKRSTKVSGDTETSCSDGL